MCRVGGALCIIYHSSLQGKNNKAKEDRVCGLYSRLKCSPLSCWITRRSRRKLHKGEGCSKGSGGEDHERMHLFLSFFF